MNTRLNVKPCVKVLLLLSSPQFSARCNPACLLQDEDEADTVGCCSLRAEHLSFPEGNTSVTLDFLGKDSMRYYQTINVSASASLPEDECVSLINSRRLRLSI